MIVPLEYDAFRLHCGSESETQGREDAKKYPSIQEAWAGAAGASAAALRKPLLAGTAGASAFRMRDQGFLWVLWGAPGPGIWMTPALVPAVAARSGRPNPFAMVLPTKSIQSPKIFEVFAFLKGDASFFRGETSFGCP